MFFKRADEEDLQPKGNEDSVQLQQMLTSCLINRQILVRLLARVVQLLFMFR